MSPLLLSIRTCVCGANVNVFGTRGLSCGHSGSHIPRHATVNEMIRCALVSGGVHAALEPVDVCHNNGKRPDGMTLISWRRGLPLVWYFTYSCSIQLVNIFRWSQQTGQ